MATTGEKEREREREEEKGAQRRGGMRRGCSRPPLPVGFVCVRAMGGSTNPSTSDQFSGGEEKGIVIIYAHGS